MLIRVDADNTYDGGECPQDLCPGSGGVPKCINGTDLVEDAVCRDSYDFEVGYCMRGCLLVQWQYARERFHH
eukprot:603851-Rhodomonas_salina.2